MLTWPPRGADVPKAAGRVSCGGGIHSGSPDPPGRTPVDPMRHSALSSPPGRGSLCVFHVKQGPIRPSARRMITMSTCRRVHRALFPAPAAVPGPSATGPTLATRSAATMSTWPRVDSVSRETPSGIGPLSSPERNVRLPFTLGTTQRPAGSELSETRGLHPPRLRGVAIPLGHPPLEQAETKAGASTHRLYAGHASACVSRETHASSRACAQMRVRAAVPGSGLQARIPLGSEITRTPVVECGQGQARLQLGPHVATSHARAPVWTGISAPAHVQAGTHRRPVAPELPARADVSRETLSAPQARRRGSRRTKRTSSKMTVLTPGRDGSSNGGPIRRRG